MFPTQTLIHATPDTNGEGRTTPFEPGKNLNAFTSFVDTSVMTPTVKRGLTITDTIGGDKASNNDPKAVIYQFDDSAFPNVALIQPRLNSVEEWHVTNFNNDAHPMHIHVNDFQVMAIDDPTSRQDGCTAVGRRQRQRARTDLQRRARGDNAGFADPAPGVPRVRGHLRHPLSQAQPRGQRLDGDSSTSSPRCRRTRWRYQAGTGNRHPYRCGINNGDEVLQTVVPFPDFEGTPSVAMADVNGDMILDLLVGTGKGATQEVVAYDGNDTADGLFRTEITRFAPFDDDFIGGVTVAGADIDGNALADNIIVGTGPGIESQVKVFSSNLPSEPGKAPEVFSTFTPYPGSESGVS